MNPEVPTNYNFAPTKSADMKSIEAKYAHLLANYCLGVKPNDRVYIKSTYLAEPLLQELIREICELGGHPMLGVGIRDQEKILIDSSSVDQVRWVDPLSQSVMQDFECYLVIEAPFNVRSTPKKDMEKKRARKESRQSLTRTYMNRTGSGEMRRSLCVYPTDALAQKAGMSLSEYRDFVFNACNLFEEDPIAHWLKQREYQQAIVDHLNKCEHIEYKGPNFEISFSCKGRKWINSDGRTNMPSGEVFTAPVEDSVNGSIYFSFPGIHEGNEVNDVRLTVKDGYIEKWEASSGMETLNEVFSLQGARRFGEAAIGTNSKIQRMTKSILFDEKIGGTIHMAVGQSYPQCGGKNESHIHWDMITDMKDGGEIYANGEKIYENGAFLIS